MIQCVREPRRPAGATWRPCSRRCSSWRAERIRITTAYFVPDDDLCTRLLDAANRGVEIDILLPGPHADKRFVQLAGEHEYGELLDGGIRI